MARVLEGRASDPEGSMTALRLMGAVHRLVLEGQAPELAGYYPSAGGDGAHQGAWEAFRSALEEHRETVTAYLDRPVQTNEVGRAAALVGGFLLVGRAWGLPLRLLEIGASAGLNLRWDHFRYEARGETWGPSDSPVRLCDFNSNRPPPFDVSVSVAERAGCDARPVDPATEDGRVTLLSYVWADQVRRIRLLRAALEVARRVPVRLDEAPAGEWLPAEVGPRPGVATVVFHSIVMQYVSHEEAGRVRRAVLGAGSRATRDAPVAWLRMEPAGEVADVRLTQWPGGEERVVATAGYHGTAVRWLGSS